MQAAVEIQELTFGYERDGFLLAIPELRVGTAENVVFTGPSGSGKTSFLHLLCGILAPTSGRIRTLGHDLEKMSDGERRRFRIEHIGIVFQEFELIEHLTVRENILLPYYLGGSLRIDDGTEDILVEAATALGIGDLLSRRPRRLSQGERQRVAVGRALVVEPEIVLADEPTGNLDPGTTRTMLDLVLEAVDRLGSTLLMVTHDHTLLESFDRTVDFGQFVRR